MTFLPVVLTLLAALPGAVSAHAVLARADLALEAQDLADHGRATEAFDLLLDGVLAAVAGAREAAPTDPAGAEVAALLLARLTAELDRWPEVLVVLQGSRPWAPGVPPRVAFLLDQLLADALRRTGRADQARGVLTELGYITDWYVAGPFDNERGSGFQLPYPPELAFDLQADMPGKERTVRWRLSPGRHHPLGQVHLDSILRPDTQAVAYLATAVHADEPGPVVLRLGTTCAYKLFLDGTELASREVERPLRSDQDHVLLDLRQGWNQLLLKTAVQEGPWRVEARLTDLQGRPARGVESRSAFCAWPGPSPHPDSIFWWELEDDPWTVEGLAGVAPGQAWGDEDPHAGHGHDDGGDGWNASAGPEPDGDGRADDGQAGGPGGEPGGEQGDGDDHGGWPGRPATDPPADWAWPVPRDPALGVTPAPEARQLLAQSERWELLALWTLLMHPDDRTELSARPHALAAVAQDPGRASAHYLVAQAEEVAGQTVNEREVNRRLHALLRTVELDPGHVAALLDLAAFYGYDNPQPDRVTELLAAAEAMAGNDWRVLRAQAGHLDDRRRGAEAEELRRLAEQGPSADTRMSALLARARRARLLGQEAESLAALWAAFRRDVLHRSTSTELFGRLLDIGELDQALYVTEKVLQAEPFDLGSLLAAAQRLESEPGVALHRGREQLTRVLDICRENEDALAALVRFELLRGSDASAALVLEELLRIDPGAVDARRHLELLTQSDQERFEQPWRWDAAELLSLPRTEGGNEPLEVLRRTVVLRVHSDGTEHRYEHVAVRALNAGGVRLLDAWPISGGGGARLHVHNARVIRADGRVENAPPSRGGGGSYRRYDLPPLSPGDVVDMEWRVDQTHADVFGEYVGLRHEFYPDRPDPLAPTLRSELVVIAPPDVPVYVAERNTDALQHTESEDAAGNRVLTWVALGLQRPPVESSMPSRSELAPVVDLTTFADWQSFARWWWSFIEKEFVTTDSMRAKVAELTEGLTTEAERIEAIARFVGQEIRYNAWAFGTHGYEPYSAATIFERRFGDCKDKSILLRQLLAEVGVEAVPVLIRAQWRRDEEPLDAAMVEHFNHCIAWLPATDERQGLYLDATADRNPVEYLRADDQGARVVHIDSKGGSLHRIPYAPPQQNRLHRRWTVDLRGDGAAEVGLLDESNGHYGVVLRSRFGGQQGQLAQHLAQVLSDSFGSVAIVSTETSALDDIAVPARLEARFTSADVWTPEGSLRSLPVSFDPLGLDGAALEPPGDRDLDLVLDRPFAHDTEIAYHLPEGASLAELPEDVSVDAEGLLRYRQTLRAEGRTIHVRRQFELLERRITPADYDRFRQALRDVQQAERHTIRVFPGETP